MKHIILTVLAILSVATPAFAERPTYYRPKPIEIENPYTLTAPKWLSARPAYMSIVNNSDKDDVLTGASTPFAKEVILQYTHDYGYQVKTMRPLENQELKIPAQSIVHLKPGGIHLLMNDLKQPLELGMEVPIKLEFKNSPDLYVKAIIHQQPDEPVELNND
tara:strand:+ start:168054 stop:168539 length:486 start_codon:yes stop_codon:yes gene_type:complete